MTRNERFGTRLRELRKEKELRDGRKWTAEAVAKELGISQTAYTNYENSLRMPNLDGIENLAAFYNKTPAYVACFSDNPGNTEAGNLLANVTITERAERSTQLQTGDIGLSHRLLQQLNINDENIFIDSVIDNSMAPELRRDDVIVVRRIAVTHSDVMPGVYVVKNAEGASFIRWIKPDLDGSVKIYPSNQLHFDSYNLSNEEFKNFVIIGEIIKVLKNPTFESL